MDELNLPVYYGGPVQVDTIHFLHQYRDWSGYEILDGVYWGGDFQFAINQLREGKYRQKQNTFFLGCQNTGRLGTLNSELQEKSWLIAQATRKLVFKDVDELWKDALGASWRRCLTLMYFD